MKIQNITDKSLKPTKVNVVLNINKLPKTFILEPGEYVYVDGESKTMITQTLRVQKQRGLINFTDEEKTENVLVKVEDVLVQKEQSPESFSEIQVNLEELDLVNENEPIINVFDLSLEEVENQKEEIIHEDIWDYLGYKNDKKSSFSNQKDWNVTLITKINMCSSEVYLTVGDSADSIEVNEKINDIIKETFLYKNDNLFGMYKIVYNNKLEKDVVLVYNSNKKNKISKLKIENFILETKKSKK